MRRVTKKRDLTAYLAAAASVVVPLCCKKYTIRITD
jgi:hypothetical protein